MPTEVDIVYFDLNLDNNKRQSLYKILSDDEKIRATRYRFDKHRFRFICGRGAIREILADRVDCNPEEVCFSLNEFGKPDMTAPKRSRKLFFNASSSETVGALAISNSHPLGFDLECIKPDSGQDYELIVKNEFTDDEYQWFTKQTLMDKDKAFYVLWTCKEAYLKALGVGLSGGLNSFSIDISKDQAVVKHTTLEKNTLDDKTTLEKTGESALSMYLIMENEKIPACLALASKNCRIQTHHW